MKTKRQDGQILVMFAGGVIALLLIAALVVDVSMVYSTQRMERSLADAAALAGAQDLQTPGSRAVTDSDRTLARTHALQNLASSLGATGAPSCSPTINISNCVIPGTPYVVSIKTPSPSAINVLDTRAVQVTVRQPVVSLGFARLAGHDTWDVAQTSVAGLGFAGQYAVITLRPPTSGLTGNTGDIRINGTGSAVVAIGGDIGMNTGATLNGNDATVSVPDGYYVRYYGATTDRSTPPGPAAYKQLKSLIADPAYPYPSATLSTPIGGKVTCPADATLVTTLAANGYGTYAASKLVCFAPGKYSATLSVNNGDVGVMLPGIHFLNQGIDLKGTLIGGYEAAVPGVAIIVPYTQEVKLTGTPPFFALNRGTAFDGRVGGQEAAPVLTTNEAPPVTLSLVVTRNPACTVVVPAPSCGSTTLDFSGFGGKGFVSIAGVVYGPSDNMEVSGNGDSRGYVGRIVAWTITYSGGSTLTQHYVGAPVNGVVRLDEACSGGNSICNP